MGNGLSEDRVTVLCICGREMKKTTAEATHKQRTPCCKCDESIAHVAVMFHCNQSNKFHKNGYNVCESCAKKRALKVYCVSCNRLMMKESNKGYKCNECSTKVKSKVSKYNYQCQKCDRITCMKCAKTPSNKAHQLMHSGKMKQVMTTLHGYNMVGPYTPSKNMVWYCDHKQCRYTKHGLYRKYRIQNWRSSKFGKNFVLCDGCVRQYEKQKVIVVASAQKEVNVELKVDYDPFEKRYRSNSDIVHNSQSIMGMMRMDTEREHSLNDKDRFTLMGFNTKEFDKKEQNLNDKERYTMMGFNTQDYESEGNESHSSEGMYAKRKEGDGVANVTGNGNDK